MAELLAQLGQRAVAVEGDRIWIDAALAQFLDVACAAGALVVGRRRFGFGRRTPWLGDFAHDRPP
jgi:hypothetical protein